MTVGSAANPLPRRWLERLQSTRRVYSCLDRDEVGQRATAALAEVLGDLHQRLQLPQGKDITEFVVTYGGNLPVWWRAETERFAPPLVQLSFLEGIPSFSREKGRAEQNRPASGRAD